MARAPRLPQGVGGFDESTSARVLTFDHVGITVSDLDGATAFFVSLGLEVEERMAIDGDFLDTVIGMTGARTQIVMLRAPDGGTGVELSSFDRPDVLPGTAAPTNQAGLRSVAFQVDDIDALVERVAADGYGLVGGIGQYENVWRMAYVRGPDGIIVALAQRID